MAKRNLIHSSPDEKSYHATLQTGLKEKSASEDALFSGGGTPALVERDRSSRLLVHQFLFAHMGRTETFTVSRNFRASQYLATVVAKDDAAADHTNAGRQQFLRNGVRCCDGGNHWITPTLRVRGVVYRRSF
jgi:hypothetical protein